MKVSETLSNGRSTELINRTFRPTALSTESIYIVIIMQFKCTNLLSQFGTSNQACTVGYTKYNDELEKA